MKKKREDRILERFFLGRPENMEIFMRAYESENYVLNEDGHKVYTLEVINNKGVKETIDFVVI